MLTNLLLLGPKHQAKVTYMEGFYKHICHPLDVCGHLTIIPYVSPLFAAATTFTFVSRLSTTFRGVSLLEFLSIQEKEYCEVNIDIG